MDQGQYRGDAQPAEDSRLCLRLEPGAGDLRSGLLWPGAGAVHRPVRGRAGLSQGIGGQLGSGRHDRAGQRAGDRRQGLALGRPGREAQAQPVVSQDHRFCRGPACRTGRAQGMAGQGAADAGKLDRQVAGPAIPFCAGRAAGRYLDRRGLLDPAGHDLRSKLHRAGGRPSADPATGQPERGARGLCRRMQGRRHHRGRAGDDGEEGLRYRPDRHPSARPGLAAAGLCRQFRADGLWHRRGFRRAGARPARSRLCPQIWPAGKTRGFGWPGSRRRICRRRGLYRARPNREQCLSRRHDDRGSAAEYHRPRASGRLGQGADHLAAARLGRFAPALLGHTDPDHPLR